MAGHELRVLYLFAGIPRRWDMASCIKEAASAADWTATVECVDICRRAAHDLSKSATIGRSTLNESRPPCSTFSRASFANNRGPRPVRCYQSPRGMDTLTSRERDRAILGNIFADFAWES